MKTGEGQTQGEIPLSPPMPPPLAWRVRSPLPLPLPKKATATSSMSTPTRLTMSTLLTTVTMGINMMVLFLYCAFSETKQYNKYGFHEHVYVQAKWGWEFAICKLHLFKDEKRKCHPFPWGGILAYQGHCERQKCVIELIWIWKVVRTTECVKQHMRGVFSSKFYFIYIIHFLIKHMIIMM